MSWTKAVWLEDNEEVEGVVPTVWVDESKSMLWWPKKTLHVVKSYKKQEVPQSYWKVFKLIKLKLSDNDEELCHTYAYTDTETSASELVIDKLTPASKSKPATLPFMPKCSLGFEKRERDSQSFSTLALKRKFNYGSGCDEEYNRVKISQKNKYDGFFQASQKIINEDNSDCDEIQFQTQQSLSSPLNKRNKYDGFPLSQANFQYRVLHLLSDIKTNGCGKCNIKEKEAKEIITEMDNLIEFDKFDLTLDNISSSYSAKQRLQNIGGKSCQKLVIAMMKSFMTNSLMAKFNMAGGKGKRSFRQTKLYKLIKICASTAYESYTESGVDAIVADSLKRAPFTHLKVS